MVFRTHPINTKDRGMTREKFDKMTLDEKRTYVREVMNELVSSVRKDSWGDETARQRVEREDQEFELVYQDANEKVVVQGFDRLAEYELGRKVHGSVGWRNVKLSSIQQFLSKAGMSHQFTTEKGRHLTVTRTK